jgi:S1-C subfamily serine protease
MVRSEATAPLPGLVAGLALGALVLSGGCAGSPVPDPQGDDRSPPASASALASPRSTEELAAAVVRLAPADEEGAECWWGSGTVVDASGTILTNFHVVENVPELCDYDHLVISLTDHSDRPPSPTYLGQVHAIDPVADLAVVRISSGLHGESVEPDLPFIPVGDSDSVALGDSMRILGYPGIGGETITFTEGKVAGFLADAEHGDRAWIKTAATIAGGNSGGTALDQAGRLVGVPTQARAGEGAQVVDCRIIEDTNGDGEVTQDDSCVPIGGFINGLRPVNLAAPLLARAGTSGPIAVEDLAIRPPATPEPSDEPPVIRSIVFSSGVGDDGGPIDTVVSLPSASPGLCGFFDYENMVDDTPYDLIWTIDGEVSEQASVQAARWSGGASGTWYVCATGDQDALPDGLWELAVYLQEETPARTDSIFVGDAHPPATLEVVNGLSEEVCYLLVSPSASNWWGQDELGQATLPPGGTVTVAVGASSYDVRARDCDQEVLVDLDDLEVSGQVSVTLR